MGKRHGRCTLSPSNISLSHFDCFRYLVPFGLPYLVLTKVRERGRAALRNISGSHKWLREPCAGSPGSIRGVILAISCAPDPAIRIRIVPGSRAPIVLVEQFCGLTLRGPPADHRGHRTHRIVDASLIGGSMFRGCYVSYDYESGFLRWGRGDDMPRPSPIPPTACDQRNRYTAFDHLGSVYRYHIGPSARLRVPQ